MDNREFIIKLDELQRDYFAKLSLLAEAHKGNLDSQFREGMRQVLVEASAKIQSVANQSEAFQEKVVGRAQKTLEMIEEQTKRLATSSSQVIQTAQEASARVVTAEGQVTERLARLVSTADSQTRQMMNLVETNTTAVMEMLKGREEQASTRIQELKQKVSNAGHDAAQIILREVNAWRIMVRWIMAPVFVGIALAAVVAAGWAGKEYGELVGYDAARAIVRGELMGDLGVHAYVLRPTFNPITGAVEGLASEILSKPIVVVDGQPRWMNRDPNGWVFGSVRLKENWHLAEVWDRKDKEHRVISYYSASH